LNEDWLALPEASREELQGSADPQVLLRGLVAHHLLTDYQAARLEGGKLHGLILGNYRVIERLGAGGMGVVFLAEHMRMRRKTAVKVLSLDQEDDPRLLLRFLTEMRAVAQLHHPNIVSAFDAGEVPRPHPDAPVLHYLVMEYVPGEDLEYRVEHSGPLSMETACDLAHQVASALAEAQQHKLVHRDIKPSNVRVTPEGQAKLLDFGLTLHFRHRLTEPGSLVGTIEYMAPEQATDASTVDIRADIYGLGGTLFWCLTGHLPFSSQGNLVEDISRRLTQQPPSVRSRRPELPPELDAVLTRMMAVDPADRYSTPQAVMRALLPFLQPDSHEHFRATAAAEAHSPVPVPATPGQNRVYQVLVVDDEEDIRFLCRYMLQSETLQCDEAVNGNQALAAVYAKPYDLVLLDIDMPERTGLEVLQQLRATPPNPHLKIVMFSGRATSDEMAQMMAAGADDYLTKPFSIVQLQNRLQAALRLKEAQDRSDLLHRHLLAVNTELEANLSARDSDLVDARNALVLALAKLIEYRDAETGPHLRRLQRFSRCLAEEAARLPLFAAQIDQGFIQMLECCVPLHDIGKVGLPDHLLMKPGKLDSNERLLMQTHTVMGAETLAEVARQHGRALAFMQMAIDIARHHHERWDGTGYPDRLAGSAIPLAARLVAVADVYDALRSRRSYKPALSHAAALQVMAEGSEGQFDPALVQALRCCAGQFEQIFNEIGG
jgi:response regulator RpfG family c-di-GMP phosphodiesterase